MISVMIFIEIIIIVSTLLVFNFYNKDLRREKDMLEESNNVLGKEIFELKNNIKSLKDENYNMEIKLKETIVKYQKEDSKKEYEDLLLILKTILNRFTNKEIVLDCEAMQGAKNEYIHIEDMDYEFAKRIKLISKKNILKGEYK